MRWLRKALLQTLIWLTTAATLLAGTPHVQCRCPSGAVKALCATPAQGCCCCSKTVGAEDAPPSCCPEPPTLKDDPAAPAFRQDGCHKELAPPADATMQRLHVEGSEIADLVLAAFDSLADEAIAHSHPVSFDIPPLPPPVDLQLVLQHFVI